MSERLLSIAALHDDLGVASLAWLCDAAHADIRERVNGHRELPPRQEGALATLLEARGQVVSENGRDPREELAIWLARPLDGSGTTLAAEIRRGAGGTATPRPAEDPLLAAAARVAEENLGVLLIAPSTRSFGFTPHAMVAPIPPWGNESTHRLFDVVRDDLDWSRWEVTGDGAERFAPLGQMRTSGGGGTIDLGLVGGYLLAAAGLRWHFAGPSEPEDFFEHLASVIAEARHRCGTDRERAGLRVPVGDRRW